MTPLDNQELRNILLDFCLPEGTPELFRSEMLDEPDFKLACERINSLTLSVAYRIGNLAIGEDGKVHGHMRPQGYPSIDLTESYRNELRKEQRQRLKELTVIKE